MKNSQNIVTQNYDSFFDENFVDDRPGKICKIQSLSLCYLDKKDDVDLDDYFVLVQDIIGVFIKGEGNFCQILNIKNSQKIWIDLDNVFFVKES